MNESFEITVDYKNKTYSFNSRLVQYGYTHRIIVSVNDVDIIFEPDEERNYRAFVEPSDTNEASRQLDIDLLKAIAETIESIVK